MAPATQPDATVATDKQRAIDAANARFWNELCGTVMAKTAGLSDTSPESLQRYDALYLKYYPYLFKHIPFDALRGKAVLEVGLGYGTVAQKIVESGAQYTGLDISPGPVAMANDRIGWIKGTGKAQQGSILNSGLPSESFDYVVAIGCLHHTGDLQRAIDECRRMLKPGGQLIFMVYYAYSYRRFRQDTFGTLGYFFREALGHRGVLESGKQQRAAYDANDAGEAAPATVWVSHRSLRFLCQHFAKVTSLTENIDTEPPFYFNSRELLLASRWPRIAGLDLYATATK